jgi:hypothetical protein
MEPRPNPTPKDEPSFSSAPKGKAQPIPPKQDAPSTLPISQGESNQTDQPFSGEKSPSPPGIPDPIKQGFGRNPETIPGEKVEISVQDPKPAMEADIRQALRRYMRDHF